MCVILDNDVVHQVFISDDRLESGNDNRPEAGKAFFSWIDSGKGKFVIGGKLLRELSKTRSFRNWFQAQLLSGRVRRVDDQKVSERTQALEEAGLCRSDDKHIIALAQISGARLLYSNDRDLTNDFRDTSLIENPQGRVYTTRKDRGAPPEQDHTRFRRSHRELLKRNVCQT